MEKSIAQRQASIGYAAGGAEAVRANLSTLRINTDVYLSAEDFRPALVVELQEIEDRVNRIFTDLHNLSQADDPIGWGNERHRLANRGAEPAEQEAVAA